MRDRGVSVFYLEIMSVYCADSKAARDKIMSWKKNKEGTNWEKEQTEVEGLEKALSPGLNLGNAT